MSFYEGRKIWKHHGHSNEILTGLPQSVHEERSDCIFHCLYDTWRRYKGSGKYRGKTGERGTGTPAFCVLTRTIFLPPPPPFHSERPQRRPIDLNSLHVLFSHGGSCLFIVRAYTCAWIRRILKETVLKSFITGPTLRKQNMQAKEVYCVPNNQRSLQTSGERGYAELSHRRTDYNSWLHLLNP